MHGTEGAGPAGGGSGAAGPGCGQEDPGVFGGGQQEHGDPGSTEAAGSPAALIAGVSQTEISQASVPAAGGGCGKKIIQITLLRTSYGGVHPAVHPAPSPHMCSLLPTASQLAQDPSKAAGGVGGPQHLCETPRLTEQHCSPQLLTPPRGQRPWGVRKRTPRAPPALGRAAANPGWRQA